MWMEMGEGLPKKARTKMYRILFSFVEGIFPSLY